MGCEMKFDVSGGDTSFVINEDMTFETLDVGVNGHNQDIIDAPPPVKPFKTIEEEDPYEKIEIKKSKDEVTDQKTAKDVSNESVAIQKGKKEKEKDGKKVKETTLSSSKPEKDIQKQSKEENMSTSKKKHETKQHHSEKIKETREKEEITKVQNTETTETTINKTNRITENENIKGKEEDDSNKKVSTKSSTAKQGPCMCIHDVKVSDACNKCSADQSHKTLDRSGGGLSERNQKNEIQGSGEKQYESKTETENQVESKSLTK